MIRTRSLFGRFHRELRRSIPRRSLARGRAALLVEQLELKFGPLPADVRKALVDGSSDDVDVWARRVIFASTLEDVFAPRS